jgi:subtilisin family serine protease
VSSPGTGWNVLTVGGVNDGTDRLWYDGSCPCSGAQYDEHAGVFYKPDVSAPAANVTTANGLSASGTSVATPIVSGIAAQLFARDPIFIAWPEATRAIIMASAAHQAPLPGGGINRDHEGVGEADARAANRVWANGTTWGGWTFGTMTTTTPIVRSFSVAAGKRVRAVLTWDSHGSGAIFDKTDSLTADLDLYATYPGGSASSITYDNASEFLSFTASSSGTVTLSIHAPLSGRWVQPFCPCSLDGARLARQGKRDIPAPTTPSRTFTVRLSKPIGERTVARQRRP